MDHSAGLGLDMAHSPVAIGLGAAGPDHQGYHGAQNDQEHQNAHVAAGIGCQAGDKILERINGLPLVYRKQPTIMPRNKDEYTSLVIKARTMAATGGSKDATVPRQSWYAPRRPRQMLLSSGHMQARK